MDDLQRRISIANARRAELLKRTEEARALAAAARGAARAEAELAEAEDELFEPLTTAWCEWGLAMLWLLLAPAQFTLSAIFVVVTLSFGGKYEVLFIASVCLLFALPLFGYCASSFFVFRCCCAAQRDVKPLVRTLSICNLASSLLQLVIFAVFSRIFDRTGFCALALALCHAAGAASFIVQLNVKGLLRLLLSQPARGSSPVEGSPLLPARSKPAVLPALYGASTS